MAGYYDWVVSMDQIQLNELQKRKQDEELNERIYKY
jgi:hypothetical protein